MEQNANPWNVDYFYARVMLHMNWKSEKNKNEILHFKLWQGPPPLLVLVEYKTEEIQSVIAQLLS